VAPPCEAFARGCGGSAWQHVARAAQLAAKQEHVVGALRKLPGLRVHPIADPGPALGWRRRARFHVAGGEVGLYAYGSHRVVPLAHCPQLEPRLDAALAIVVAARPPDGELALVVGHRGDVLVATDAAWPAGAALIGCAGITGVNDVGARSVELEDGLHGGAWDFAQASAAGNAALVAQAVAALGPGPGDLLELHAGSGNLTRAYAAAGWTVTPSDVVQPVQPPRGFITGSSATVLAAHSPPLDAIALDPPRTGAADAIAGIVRLAPQTIVYVSCDLATLARDAQQLVTAGYAATGAWPLDLMPHTSHVETVLVLRR
jgi:23S rRNA (uracil1939-C5)-methyltransferase